MFLDFTAIKSINFKQKWSKFGKNGRADAKCSKNWSRETI